MVLSCAGCGDDGKRAQRRPEPSLSKRSGTQRPNAKMTLPWASRGAAWTCPMAQIGDGRCRDCRCRRRRCRGPAARAALCDDERDLHGRRLRDLRPRARHARSGARRRRPRRRVAGGRATIATLSGWLFVSHPEEPVISRFTVNDAGQLEDEVQIELREADGLEVAEIHLGATFVSADKAYLFNYDGGVAIVERRPRWRSKAKSTSAERISCARAWTSSRGPGVVVGDRLLKILAPAGSRGLSIARRG